jgi:hypothetical protein
MVFNATFNNISVILWRLKTKKTVVYNNSVTEKLFGDDLQKKIEDISKLRKIIISNFDDKQIIFTVLIKEGAHCRQHSQTI